MRLLRIVCSALIISPLAVFSVSAELAEKDVTQWLASMDDVKVWTAEHKEQIEQENLIEKDLKDMDSIYTKALGKLTDLGLYDSFNSMIQAQGYDTANDWALVSQDITNCPRHPQDLRQYAADLEQYLPQHAAHHSDDRVSW